MNTAIPASRPRTRALAGLAVAAVTLPLVGVVTSPAGADPGHTHTDSSAVHEVVIEEMKAPLDNVQTRVKGDHTFTAPKEVPAGTAFTETATVPVPDGRRRLVQLQVREQGTWRTVGKLRASKDGRVTFVHRSLTKGVAQHRFVAPAVEGKGGRAALPEYVSPVAEIEFTGRDLAPRAKQKKVKAEPTSRFGAWLNWMRGLFRRTPPAPAPEPTPEPEAPEVPEPEVPEPETPTAPEPTEPTEPTEAPAPTPAPEPTDAPAPTEPTEPTVAPSVPTPSPGSSVTPIPADPSGAYDAAEYLSPAGLRGSASDWRTLTGTELGWSTCKPITWSYDPSGSYTDSLKDLQASFARVSGVSGLKFKYVGGPENAANIKVNWKPRSHFNGAVGVATPRYIRETGGKYRLTDAVVSFNYDYPMAPGLEPAPGSMYSVGQLFQHEIMHAVGLHHASTNTQLMYPSVSPQAPRMGAGDHAGLIAVGKAHPC